MKLNQIACPSDCPNCSSASDCKKSSSKVAAVVGGAVGGVCFVVIIGILAKKGVFTKAL